MTEGLVKSDGKVKVETKKSGDIDLTATVVEGEDDVVLQSAGNMTVASTASRTVQGENYADRAHQASVKSRKGHLLVEAQLDTFFKGTNTYSKKGTTFKGNGRLVDETLALASKTVTREGKNWTRDIYTVKQPSVHVSDGHITETYQGRVDTVATHFVVPKDKEVVIFGFEGVTAHEDHNTHEHASHQEKGKSGWFGRGSTSDFQSQSATSIGMKVTGGTAKVISGVGDIVLENVHFAVDKTTLTVIDDACKVLIKPGTHYFSSAFSGKSADMFWQTMTARTVQSQTYSDSQFDGELTIEAREAIVTQVCGRTLAFMDRIQIKDGKISLEYVHELYDVKEQGCSGPTAALSAVIAIAATMTAVISGGATMAANAAVSASGFAAGTMGASVISAMGYAGFSALCAQTAMALAQNRGDPLKSAQAVFQKDSLKAIAIAMGSAGALSYLGQALSIPVAASEARGVVDHVQRQALQQGVQAAFSLADGQRLDPQRIAVSVAAQGLGAIGANKIGEYYTNQMVDGVTHKLLHLGMASGVGGLSGALTGDDVGRQALASGIGALAAETMHDIIKEDETAVAQRVAQKAGERGIDLRDTVRTRPIILDEIRTRLEVSKFSGAMAAFFAKQDVNVASTAATTAVENNSGQAAVLGVQAALLRLGLLTVPIAGVAVVEQSKKPTSAFEDFQKLKEELGGKPDDKAADKVKPTQGGEAPNPDPEEPKDHDKRQPSAQNRADHERHKRQLREDMAREPAAESELKDLLEQSHRPGGTVGSGSTAAAVRHELATGEKVGGRSHTQKAQDSIKALSRWLRKNPDASNSDKAAAENTLKDLMDSLGM